MGGWLLATNDLHNEAFKVLSRQVEFSYEMFDLSVKKENFW